jgi:hypothetical protein
VTRVAVCGRALDAATAVLGLEPVEELPDLVLVDLHDAAGIIRASSISAEVPRVAVGGPEDELLLRAVGAAVAFATTADAASLGPLVSQAVPPVASRSTRTVLVTGPAGGAGRTLLVAHLAVRLAARASVIVLDVTGAGTAGWWLGLSARGWSDLEGLAEELTSEHLAVVAAEQGRLRVVGGAPSVPSPALALAAVRAAAGLADIVLIDAPAQWDERARSLRELADRVLLVASDDPSCAAALDDAIDDRTWLIGSRTRAQRIAGHAVVRAIPDDPAAVRAAAQGPSAVGGAVGRAYDEIAELLAIDAE